MMFLVLGAVSASESINVSSTEDSNLISDNVDMLSAENKLEVSSEDSISETNIVNSHDDNLGTSPDDDVLQGKNLSEENNEEQLASVVLENDDVAQGVTGSNIGGVIAVDSSNDDVNVAGSADSGEIISAKKASKLYVYDTHYDKSATYFKVTLKDYNSKGIANQKISLKVNGKTYSDVTNKDGTAFIKTASLAIGSYSLSLSYAGNTNYNSSSLSRKVNVLSSVVGSDLTKTYGSKSAFKATFWKDASPMVNSKVQFKINGKTYTAVTDKNGVAKLSIKLDVGKYTVTVINPYSNEQTSNNVVVKKDSSILKRGNTDTTYIIPDTKFYYSVTLTSKNNQLIKDQKVYFTFNGKTVTEKTDENGKATFAIPALAKGTYSIQYEFKGNKNYYATSSNGTLIVKNPTTKVSASPLKMRYGDGSKVSAKFTDTKGNVLAKKDVKFRINGVYYSAKTDKNGVAKFAFKGIKPGNYKYYAMYSKAGLNDYNVDSAMLTISKGILQLSTANLVMKYKDGSSFRAVVKDKSGKRMSGIQIKTTFNGKSHIYKTDKHGVAELKVTDKIGYYKVTSALSDSRYESNTVYKHILVNGTKFKASKEIYVPVESTATLNVKLLDGKDIPIRNAIVTFTLNGKTTKVKSDSNGIAKFTVSGLSKGDYTVKYSHDTSTRSSIIHVVGKVTINQIIASSKEVKNYIDKNHKLPSTVKVGAITLSTYDYLYVAAKAVSNLKSGNKGDIAIKYLKKPSSEKSSGDLGNLYDYLSVAKSIVKTADSKGQMPDSVGSKVGPIGYKELVYGFARIVAYYGTNNNVMPSYVEIRDITHSSSISLTTALNSKNTIKNLAAYLSSTLHCQVNDAKVKELVSRLTKNCKTDWQKAEAIYNFVRDTVSYSFYYDTRYGAVGTLNAKTGNCVDHSHALAALFRAANLPTRYAHGTCTFSSGGTYGHVWTQVLIGDTWTVADATSSRNSLGRVVNWNSNSYSLHGYYSSLPF